MTQNHNNQHPPPTAMTSIILPTYKERDNIVELVQAIHSHLEAQPFDYEVVIVDDNSPDGTADVVRAAFGDDPRVQLHVRTARARPGSRPALRRRALRRRSAGLHGHRLQPRPGHDPADDQVPGILRRGHRLALCDARRDGGLGALPLQLHLQPGAALPVRHAGVGQPERLLRHLPQPT